MFTLAHLSDPHLAPLPEPSWRELLGKRVTGYINWKRKRRFVHDPEALARIVADLKAQGADHVAVTGDIANIALAAEFRRGRDWLESLGSATEVTFVPGNHDWNHWGKRGWDYVLNQQQWIDSLKDESIVLSPRDGCPGPVLVNIDEHHLLLILDTQWMLHRWEKPGKSACGSQSVDDVLRRISDIFEQNSHKRIIVAAHHPLITYGEHGGVFSLRSHIFPLTELSKNLYIPLPLIGSIYPLYRKWFGHIQDTAHRSYRKFAQAILAIMARHPGSIFVAGHEHALQYIVKDGVHVIVSGTGAKTEHVRKKQYAVLATDVRGFVQVSTFVDGTVSLHFFQVDAEHPGGKEIFTQYLQMSKQHQYR